MNDFEKDVQSKGNDFVDALKGFNYSFGFFAIIFIIGIVIQQIMS
ncbi:YqzM-like protein [Scopulibacillus darangshiensis]|uniref:YqzM-like protein n=1 Tax=Scopulibacillus darangshiensis TaxID=442528 RepID=A0A4R2PEG6_9BACL|nr:YqzM family protein [Scopulibacillus darangshiensis]TCP32325.1 YqzM-like protein [Scopulibacillus darangshiensis]